MMTCHGFDRFLSVEDEDLVSPHIFEDNTPYVLLCLFKYCLSCVWDWSRILYSKVLDGFETSCIKSRKSYACYCFFL